MKTVENVIALNEIRDFEIIKSNLRVRNFKLAQHDTFKQRILMKIKISSFCFEHDFQKNSFEKKTGFSCRM